MAINNSVSVRIIKRIVQGGLVKCVVIVIALAVTLPAHAFFELYNYTKTKHPIVLVHGMVAVGHDFMWPLIPQSLRLGGAEVYMVDVSSFNSSEMRGEQAARQIEEILAISGAQKVNLIGHSHGSHTSRYVASVYPEYIASVTSFAGPNWGTPVADLVARAEDGSPDLLVQTVSGAVNQIGPLFAATLGTAGNPQDSLAGLHSLTTEGALAFNVLYPEGMPEEYCGEGDEVASNGVHYYSMSGASVLTNPWDLSDPLLALTSLAFLGEASDGMVSTCSSHLGVTIRDNYYMNHVDEVNHLLGLRGLFGDPIAVYRQQANRLKKKGL